MTRRPDPTDRPPRDLAARPVSVHLHLSPVLYDKAYAAARDARQTVPSWIRDQVRAAIDNDNRRPPRS